MSGERRTALRILDANHNRGREAFRVMEEFARFVLDDGSLTKALKNGRHELRAAIRSLETKIESGTVLPRSRDIEGDVGRNLTTVEQGTRGSNEEVLRAACGRLGEALRALEEYGKVVDSGFAEAVEQLRYRAYEWERRLSITLAARQRFADVRLYVILTESLCRANWLETARAVIDGGADALQLREKHLSDGDLLERARQLAALCRAQGKLFVMNDRVDVAVAAGADGVHLGQNDLPLAAARRILPAHGLIGLSTHNLEQVKAGVADAPDYLAVGPMFPTDTKPGAQVAGPSLLAEARARTGLPLVAIGGIRTENVAEVVSAAPCTICVCSSIIATSDPASAVRSLRASVSEAMSSTTGP